VAVIEGFTTACKENGCALIGGEMAEMPGMYRDDDYDLAGTIVGIVDRGRIIDGSNIQAGDVVLGLPSTGLHTNGYSLARRVLLDAFEVTSRPSQLGGETLGDALLRVHRSYLKPIRALVDADLTSGLAHVTGGGIEGNTKRVIPEGLSLEVSWNSWTRPALFGLIQELGDVPETDMRSTFNLGIGLVIVARSDRADEAMAALEAMGEEPLSIGRIVVGVES